jgi:hypothetical protein
MKIGVCLIIKNENEYLEEWLAHYRGLGVDKFFIYDNNSSTPITSSDDDVDVILWKNEKFGSQNNAYLNCCKTYSSFDYIGFFDTDEFYYSKTMNIKTDINNLTEKFGDFNGLAIYWRMYGKTKPYFTERQPIINYKQYHVNDHIKSFLTPKSVIKFNDPHFGNLRNKKYIDELGRNVVGPVGEHTSENIWIKHVWTRSETEFKEKLIRGDANLRGKSNRTFNEFYDHNDNCILND